MVDLPTVMVDFQLFYHFLDIDPLGPMIDGDLVIQGSLTDVTYGPVLTVVEAENDGEIEEIAFVPPSRMIITSPEGGPEEGSASVTRFMIPVSIEPKHWEKQLTLKIYMKQMTSIKYDASSEEENITELSDPINRHEYFLSVVVTPNNGKAQKMDAKQLEEIEQSIHEKMNETEEDVVAGIISERKVEMEGVTEEKIQTNEEEAIQKTEIKEDDFTSSLIIKSVRIATDYDEVISLQHEGMELCCTLVTPTGIINDQDHIWKFHVLAEFGKREDGGVEDLMFIKCLKSLGTLPSIPFFEVLHDYDLSKPEDGVSNCCY
jgi:hypothetical protein